MSKLRLSRKTEFLGESPTSRIDSIKEELRRKGIDLIDFSAGEPGFPPPKWLREKIAEVLLKGSRELYSYTPSPGILELREAIAQDLIDYGGPSLDPNQIVVTAGGQAAMYSSLSAVIDEGDEVILFDPTYFGYEPLVKYLGGRVKWIPTVPESYQPDTEALKEVASKGRAKAVIVVTPDNPTGRVLKKSVAKAIAEIAVDYGLWIIADEAYRTLIYEGEHVYIYEYAPENTIAINVFSKDPGIPGWRLAYIYSSEEVAKRIALASEQIVYNPPTIAQYLVLEYLKNRKGRREHVEFMKRTLGDRRRVMLEAVKKYIPKARLGGSAGGMFVYLNLSEYLKSAGVSGEKLAENLLRKELVAAVPGSYFGPGQRYALRLSFAVEGPDRIKEGVKRLSRLLVSISASP